MLAAYMSPKSPYSGLLLYHATGTGKTCTAITICRQFSTTFSKPPLVIFPSTLLVNNFKKEVDGCGKGKTSFSEIDPLGWEYRGAIEFANDVKRLEDEAGKDKGLFEELIKESYSDRVIIIDEAHNLRSNEEDNKQVPPRLIKVLRVAQNIRLIMLTATPMFDTAREIVFLMNLLLANDNRKEIREKDVFDAQDNIKADGGAKVLADVSRGYVSFQGIGKDGAFPKKLYPPKQVLKKVPRKDMYGNPIGTKIGAEANGIVFSGMQDEQLRAYRSISSKISKDRDRETSAFDSEDNPVANNPFTRLRMAANVIFPSPGVDFEKTKNAVKYITGVDGYNRCFRTTSEGTISYRTNVPEFLTPKLISKYACKIDSIMQSISKCDGIVLVHSTFVVCGLLPLAIALEHAGYQRYGGTNLMAKQNGTVKNKKMTYVLWTGQSKFSSNKDAEIEIAKRPDNADGNIIKVILASDVATEGIDLKCVREVHIMDPWYNVSKINQVFGRAIRHNSHISLPANKRNVTVYQHAAVDEISNTESIDMRTYRIAYEKQRKIDSVTDLLREHAIDECLSNKNDSNIDRSTFDVFHAANDVRKCAAKIRNCFTNHISLKYEQILDMCSPIDEEIFIWSLQSVLDDPTDSNVYNDIAKTMGKVIYASDKYIFQPSHSTDPRLTMAAREGQSVASKLSKATLTSKIERKTSDPTMADVEKRAAMLISEIGCDAKIYGTAAIDYVLDRMTCKSHISMVSTDPQNVNLLRLPHVVVVDDVPLYIIDFEASKSTETYLKWRPSKRSYDATALDEHIVKKKERAIQQRISGALIDVVAFVTFSEHRIFKMISGTHRLTGTSCLTTSTIKKRAIHDHIKSLDPGAVSTLDVHKSTKGAYCDMYELILRTKRPHLFLRPYEYKLATEIRSKKTI
jgi:hypothetical protein